jgi:hypothetical protein
MSVDDKCVNYLELFRDEKYLELSELLEKENAAVVAAFCYYLSKYEGVHHLNFLRHLLQRR